MKKCIYTLVAALVVSMGLTSCSSVRHTASTVPVDDRVATRTSADLNVATKKISYTYRPSSSVRRAGDKAVIQTAVAEALKANGNADVLVAFQYEIKKTGKKINYVTVEGYPASYSNFTVVKPCK